MPDEPKSPRKRLGLGRRDPNRPGAVERGRMRRRLRRQRHVREALLIELGALVFELHRQGRREPELLQTKAAELTAVDEEVRALSDTLEVQGTLLELTAAGIAGGCSQCGAIMPLGASYCSRCGASQRLALSGAPAGAEATAAATPIVSDEPPPLPLEEADELAELGTEERAALERGDLERADTTPGPPIGEEEEAEGPRAAAEQGPAGDDRPTQAWAPVEAHPAEEEPLEAEGSEPESTDVEHTAVVSPAEAPPAEEEPLEAEGSEPESTDVEHTAVVSPAEAGDAAGERQERSAEHHEPPGEPETEHHEPSGEPDTEHHEPPGEHDERYEPYPEPAEPGLRSAEPEEPSEGAERESGGVRAWLRRRPGA